MGSHKPATYFNESPQPRSQLKPQAKPSPCVHRWWTYASCAGHHTATCVLPLRGVPHLTSHKAGLEGCRVRNYQTSRPSPPMNCDCAFSKTLKARCPQRPPTESAPAPNNAANSRTEPIDNKLNNFLSVVETHTVHAKVPCSFNAVDAYSSQGIGSIGPGCHPTENADCSPVNPDNIWVISSHSVH